MNFIRNGLSLKESYEAGMHIGHHRAGRILLGFYYSFSTDLVNWTRRKLLLEVDFPWTVANPADTHYLYPSLLDPQSEARNFETTGRVAYLYFTRNNAGLDTMDLDRDLIRVPVRFEIGSGM